MHPKRVFCSPGHHSEWMKKNNPSRKKEVRDKISATLKKIGHKPTIQGGNGKPRPVPEILLHTALGGAWINGYRVNTGTLPRSFEIDIVRLEGKIAIEVDGYSHCSLERQKQDRRKERILKKLGWKVLRFSNQEVLNGLDEVLEKVREFTTYKSQEVRHI